jgi:hypothetical protein
MGKFRHPHLTRGVVHTPQGGFTISRGVVIVPDEIGEAYGWQRIDADERDAAAASRERRTTWRDHPLAHQS